LNNLITQYEVVVVKHINKTKQKHRPEFPVAIFDQWSTSAWSTKCSLETISNL